MEKTKLNVQSAGATMKQFNVLIKPDLYKSVLNYCSKMRMSQALLVNMALTNYLNKKEHGKRSSK